MDSIKILHTGDLHLDSPMVNMGELSQERKKELLKTFTNIINLAIEEKVDAILISGDMFENSNPNALVLNYVSNEFERINDIKIFIVLGNHDYGLKFKFPSNVYVFNDYIEKVNIGNVDIYGVSFDEEHVNRCIIEGFSAENEDNINVFLIHGEIQNKSDYNPITTENISYSKMDYMALGHVHSHDGFKKAGITTYSYCGIPEGRAFDECGEKGVVIAEIGKGYAKCKFVPVCGRKFMIQIVDISGAEDNYAIAEKIASQLSGEENAYRIILTGRRNTFIDLTFIKNQLEKSFYYVELEDNSTEETESEYSLKNLFMKNCPNEDAKKYGLTALRGEKVIIE